MSVIYTLDDLKIRLKAIFTDMSDADAGTLATNFFTGVTDIEASKFMNSAKKDDGSFELVAKFIKTANSLDNMTKAIEFVNAAGGHEAGLFVKNNIAFEPTTIQTNPMYIFIHNMNDRTITGATIAGNFVRAVGGGSAAEFVTTTTKTLNGSTVPSPDVAKTFVNDALDHAAIFVKGITASETTSADLAAQFVSAAGVNKATSFVAQATGEIAVKFFNSNFDSDVIAIANANTSQNPGLIIKKFYDAIPSIKQGTHQIDNSTYVVKN